MIEIINGKILVDGKETTNPELIGLAMLDLAENTPFRIIEKDIIKEKK